MSTLTTSITSFTTATRTITSLPLFFPSDVPVTTSASTMANDDVLGGVSYAQLTFLGSVVNANPTAVVYALDCTQSVAARSQTLESSSAFMCPYSGAIVTSGPSTFVYQQNISSLPAVSVACSTIVSQTPKHCIYDGTRFPSIVNPPGSIQTASPGALVFSNVPIVITAGHEKLISSALPRASKTTAMQTPGVHTAVPTSTHSSGSAPKQTSTKPSQAAGPALSVNRFFFVSVVGGIIAHAFATR